MHAARPAGSAPSIPGMDWCGDVVEVGAEVRGFKTGDRVMCSGSGPGGYAEYAVTDWGRVLPAPAGLGDEQAAVTMLALQTMHDALIVNGGMKAGDAVLIQGASVQGSAADAGRKGRQPKPAQRGRTADIPSLEPEHTDREQHHAHHGEQADGRPVGDTGHRPMTARPGIE